MAGFDDVEEVLHRVEVKLYPNTLPGAPAGELVARIDDEAILTIEDVCASMKKRGGYEGSYDKLVADVKQFYEELVYQLCDGYSVGNEFYSIRLKIGGTWAHAGEKFDPQKHPLSITFRMRQRLHDALQHIKLEAQVRLLYRPYCNSL